MEYKPGMWVRYKDEILMMKEEIEQISNPSRWECKDKNGHCAGYFPEKDLDLINIKIRLPDDMEERKRQSEAIQLKAFGHGLKWPGQISNYVDKTESVCIFLEYENGKILRDLTDEYFQGYDDIELTPAEFLGDEIKGLSTLNNSIAVSSKTYINPPLEHLEIIPNENQSIEIHCDYIEITEEPHIAGITPEPRHYPQTAKYKCPQCNETGTKIYIQCHHRDSHDGWISTKDPRWNDWKVN